MLAKYRYTKFYYGSDDGILKISLQLAFFLHFTNVFAPKKILVCPCAIMTTLTENPRSKPPVSLGGFKEPNIFNTCVTMTMQLYKCRFFSKLEFTRFTFSQPLLNTVGVIVSIVHVSLRSDKPTVRFIKQNGIKRNCTLNSNRAKVTVWFATESFGIIGPYFFEDDNGTSVTVTSQRYVRMIQEFLSPQIANNPLINRDTWFQQDGATSHTARFD
ncbi:hypothetical protein ANN_15264 [Periplaneta americana]|uniref:Transposable element Tc3 transposase n=1 Tax=Periplaneta americana TaxID=6978 RepID=A0ABQ8SH01_PERAM|nr:hypothetical protein ANN_15264 [Periplaneta americana]